MGARSPIFGMPQAPQGLLGLDRRKKQQLQAVADTLTQLGIGLMGQGTSTTPQSPLQGLAQGLQGASQMQGVRQGQAQDERRMDMAEQQFGMQQQDFQAKQQFEQARQAQLEKLIAGLTPEQQAAARGNPDAFFKAYSDSLFPKKDAQPGSVQEYEYAKSQGFKGSLLDYETQKAAAGRAPTAADKPTADIQEYQFAVSQGFKGSYMDYLASKKGQGMSVTLPDGTVMQVGGAVKPPNESQMNAASRAQLIQTGLTELEKLYDNPDIDAWRMAGAETLAKAGPMGGVAANKLKTDAEQQWAAAQSSALEGLAASVTGAGVSTDQFTRYTNMLPAITDKPETRKAKMKAANNYLKVLLKNAGAAGQAVIDNLPKEEGATPVAPTPPKAAEPIVAPELKPEDGWQ
jgi:hypothetical protein